MKRNAAAPSFSPNWWQWVLLLTVLALGLTAPFGTTALGLLSISDIRHSDGCLVGMPLALADALLFPLLILDCLIVMAVLLGVYYFIHDPTASRDIFVLTVAAPAMLGALVACAVVDFLLARAAWRKATTGLQ